MYHSIWESLPDNERKQIVESLLRKMRDGEI